MKRQQVMRLYHPIPDTEPKDEWVSVDAKLPTCKAGLFQVKLGRGSTTYAHYYLDSMSWIARYGGQLSHWWHTNIDEPILDVTHYRQVS